MPIQVPPVITLAAMTQPTGVTAAPMPSNARKPVGAKKVEATADDLATTAAVVATPATSHT